MTVPDTDTQQLPTASGEGSTEQVSEGSAPARSALRRRRRMLAMVCGGTVLLGAAGMAAAAWIKSPAQVAADTAAPPADVLTAAAERRVLAETVVTRGQVTASQSVQVSSAGPGGDGAGRSVVTKVKAKAGEPVAFGRVLLEVSGRPVFALPGALPAYRDLKPGDDGQDVQQLQQALASVGHSTAPDRPGHFGAGTERAVRGLYAALGYTPRPVAENKEPEAKKPATAPAPSTHPMVAMSEVVFLNSLPARADSVTAEVGAEASGTLMTISAGDLLVSGGIGLHEKGLIHPGQKVEILAETSGERATGTVVSVAQAPKAKKTKGGEDDKAGADEYTVKVKPDGRLPATMAGQEVRLTIAAASSRTKVLAVPSSAISTGADGRTTVTARTPNGSNRRIEVRTGMSGDGFVEVTPTDGARLTEGDQVVVGVDTRHTEQGRPR
ncbi:peptidoglycan-binding protein [Streptomyces rimosus]|uniref:peptidoglycan-binding protein n=1 Tax=Streptomyces rimosus TaxID=1927 RepID=UPI000A89928D|nr:peptidoglycan-binding protein [Streptomyces rimosus]